jgi:DNA polymerase III subunit chi
VTEVEFHTGLQNSISFACRLLRKASRRGVRVLVTAPEPTLAALDRALWTFDERDFIPHVRQPGAALGAGRLSPVWLAADSTVTGLSDSPKVLLNMGAAPPADVHALERLIEVVTDHADDAEQGRARWRHYKALGLEVVHHARANGQE